MQTIKAFECTADVKRDPTSYGYQWSLDLQTDEFLILQELRKLENKTIKIRVEIYEQPDGEDRSNTQLNQSA
jgi:hypothetical protein